MMPLVVRAKDPSFVRCRGVFHILTKAAGVDLVRTGFCPYALVDVQTRRRQVGSCWLLYFFAPTLYHRFPHNGRRSVTAVDEATTINMNCICLITLVAPGKGGICTAFPGCEAHTVYPSIPSFSVCEHVRTLPAAGAFSSSRDGSDCLMTIALERSASMSSRCVCDEACVCGSRLR